MKRLFLILTLVLIYGVTFTSCATRGLLPIGTYVGLEPMFKWRNLDTSALVISPYIITMRHPASYDGPLVLHPGIHHPRETDTTRYWFHSDKWFHKVTIEILSDTCINVSKVPVYFINGNKYYSESTGGFFFYQCLRVSTYRQNFFFGQLTYCKYCRKTPTAIPRYASVRYFFDTTQNRRRDRLILHTDYGSITYYRKINRLRLLSRLRLR